VPKLDDGPRRSSSSSSATTTGQAALLLVGCLQGILNPSPLPFEIKAGIIRNATMAPSNETGAGAATTSSAEDAAAAASSSSSSSSWKPPAVDEVVIHPLVLLSAADHYHRVARGTRKRVVGVLLGSVHRGKVDATNSFAVPFEEDSRNPVRLRL
jgi:hypothetical protein